MRPSKEFDKVREILDSAYLQHNHLDFITQDPIQIPHRFSKKQDIEIAGFISAVLAWGNRTSIINSANRFLDLMDNDPHNWLLNHQEHDRIRFHKFVHRTFNDTDAIYFVDFLTRYYKQHESLETAFLEPKTQALGTVEEALKRFHDLFFDSEHSPARTRKHVSTPLRKSSCKRLNMFLRWMVRKDESRVDFGIWNRISASQLMMPLDVHVIRVAKHLNLLTRNQSDWTAVEELTALMRQFDPLDPVKYDFALFGMGVMEKQSKSKLLGL